MQQPAAVCAGPFTEAAVGDSYARSDAETEGESASAPEAALMQAQLAQREAMLVSQHSLNDSRERLLEAREALQHDEDERDEEVQGEATKLSVLLCTALPLVWLQSFFLFSIRFFEC